MAENAAKDAVQVAQDGPVSIITINRPAKRNAVDGPTAGALLAAFEAFEAVEESRVAVLTGAGGEFCSGADLSAMADPATRNHVEPTGRAHGPMGPSRMAFTKPVIAAVEGHAVAGGLELALMCDMRVAARSAVFGVFCRRWGVPLIDGGTVRLPRVIGQSRALDMIPDRPARRRGGGVVLRPGQPGDRRRRRPGDGRRTGQDHRRFPAGLPSGRSTLRAHSMGP